MLNISLSFAVIEKTFLNWHEPCKSEKDLSGTGSRNMASHFAKNSSWLGLSVAGIDFFSHHLLLVVDRFVECRMSNGEYWSNLTHFNPLMGTGATSNNMMLVHWPLMGGLLHLVQPGGD